MSRWRLAATLALLAVALFLVAWGLSQGGGDAGGSADAAAHAGESTGPSQVADDDDSAGGATPDAADPITEAPLGESGVARRTGFLRILVTGAGGEGVACRLTLRRITPHTRSVSTERLGFFGEQLWDEPPLLEEESADGRFTLEEDLPGEPLAAMVEAGGYAWRCEVLDPLEIQQAVEISLDPAQPVTVRVETPAGAPVAGAHVDLRAAMRGLNVNAGLEEALPMRAFQRTVRTGADGQHVVATPHPAGMRVRLLHDSGHALAVHESARPGEEVTLVLHPTMALRGQVTALSHAPGSPNAPGGRIGRSSAPLAGAGIHVLREDPDEGTQVVASTTSAADGGYALPEVAVPGGPMYVLVQKRGHTAVTKRLPRPEPGATVEHHFTLEPASSWTIRLVDPADRPVTGVRVKIHQDFADWLPFAYDSDDTGAFTTEAVLARGRTYLLVGYRNGVRIFRQGFRTPGSPQAPEEALVVQVATLCRLEGVDLTLPEGVTLEEFALVRAGGTGADDLFWSDPEAVQWVEEGEYLLQAFLDDGRVLEQDLLLQRGDSVRPRVALDQGTLSFGLPPGTGTIDVSLLDRGNYFAARWQLASGTHRFEVPVGRYHLLLVRDGVELQPVGPVEIGEAGVDLGVLPLGAGATVSGRLLDDRGAGLPGIRISAVRGDGFRLASATTSPDGSFAFGAAPPGRYEVIARLDEAGYKLPPVVRVVDVGGVALHGPVTLIARLGGRAYWVQLPDGIEGAGLGFHLGGSLMQRAPIGADGTFLLAADTREGVAGAVVAERPAALTLCVSIAPSLSGGRSSLNWTLPAPDSSKSLRVTDGGGRDIAGVSVRFSVEGHLLPVRARSGEDGAVTLSANRSGKAVVRFEHGGVIREMRYAELPAQGEVKLRVDASPVEVVVQDARGAPLGGAQVYVPGGARAATGEDGRCRLPVGAAAPWVQVARTGFWTVRLELDGPKTVRLPRDASARRVRLAGVPGDADVAAALEAQFELGYAVNGALRRDSADAGVWHAPRLPEGPYRLVVTQGETVLRDVAVTLRADGPVELRL